MTYSATDWWTLATLAMCGAACAIVGVFLVLRKMSLLGDSITHAILPGIVGGFIVFKTRDPFAMLAGAAFAGMVTAFLASAIQKVGKINEDASLGVVFTTMFALGSVLLTFYAGPIDLDPGCVLYGSIETAMMRSVDALGFELRQPALTIGVTLLLDALLVVVFFKELKIVSFDPYLATTMGISAGLVHYGLMSAVAGTSVVMFESVGSILVVALLVAPAATAQLLADRLKPLILIAVSLGISAGILGHLGAVYWNTSVAGMVSVACGVQFIVAVFFAPRHGLVAARYRRLHLSVRIKAEDVLGRLYRELEQGQPVVETAPPRGLVEHVAIVALKRSRLVRAEGARFILTSAGIAAAADLIRGHRLWERFLAEQVGLPLDHLHEPSHRVEHFLSEPMKAELSKAATTPTDPHGKPIPKARVDS